MTKKIRMRQKIFSGTRKLWEVGNTHLGSVLIGLAGGYFITKAARQKEMIDLQKEIKEKDQQIRALKERLGKKSDEFQQVLEAGISRRFETQDCLRRLDFTRYAFGNSYCLFRQQHPEDIKLMGSPTLTNEDVISLSQK